MTNRNKKSAKQKTKAKPKQLFAVKLWLLFPIVVVAILGLAYLVSQNRNLPPPPPPPADAIYKQASQPIEARVSDLLNRMTLDEKIGQMALVDKNSLKKTEDISRYNLGGILSGAGAKPQNNTPKGWLEMVDGMKKQALESRLGIPILYGIDANHGNGNVPGSTVFPHAIGLGAANDPELTKSVATATSREVAATGINWSFSPSLDAPLDIRWGRVYEAFSDDPAINAKQGAAFIEGTQQVDTKRPGKPAVLATAKHFMGTGSMEWGKSKNKKFKIDQGIIPAQEELLNSHYLVPYAAASKVDVASVMVGLSFWGDGRVIDNKHLLTEKLKNEIGFKGFIVSDWYGIYEFSGTSQYKANIRAVNSGVDMAMLPFEYKEFAKDMRRAVKSNSISQSRIDESVKRILYQKFKAGLFDEIPSVTDQAVIGSEQHRMLARQAVASSAVLLKNQNNLLPLPKNAGRILVAGSGADNVGRQAGAWTIEWQGIDGNFVPGGTSILQAIRQVVGDEKSVEYEKEANFKPGIKSDVAIAVVSEKPYAEGFGDNPYPTMDEVDKLVVERLKARSDKVIIIVLSGRPLLMHEQISQANAVVAAWLPGSEGGGVADVLFGSKPFKAKLPLPWPSGLNQVPTNVDGKTANGSQPLFDRGFGL